MEPVQRTVPEFLSRLLQRAPLSAEKLTFAWKTSVGPAIARASSVRLSTDGVVEVQCGDDHWRREIKRSMPIIKERLIALLGAEVVRQVKVPGSSGRRARDVRGPKAEGGSRQRGA